MRRFLQNLWGRLGEARPSARSDRRVRPQVEALGERVLPATGLGLGLSQLNWQIRPPVIIGPPGLAGRSVELTATDQSGNPLDVGTLVIQTQDWAGNFTGTFENHMHRIASWGGDFGDTYDTSLDMGPIAVSGRISANPPWWLGTYTITFGSVGDDGVQGHSVAGTVHEHHNYFASSSGMVQNEDWNIPDRQSINFTGTVAGTWSTLSLSGTADVVDDLTAKFATDHNPVGTDHSTWWVPVHQEVMASVSNNPFA
jgi:hypothetical protein